MTGQAAVRPGYRGAAGPWLSAGVITADLTRLGAELDVIRGRAAWAHVDVMDGSFCPQLTVGPSFIKAVASTGVPVDAHLMVADPLRLLPEVVGAGPAIVTVHAESGRHPHRVLTELTRLSDEVRPVIRGYALNPGTPVQVIEPVLDLVDLVLVLAVSPGWPGQSPAANTAGRIAAVREITLSAGRPVLVGVDGGVTLANATEVAGWGADIVVSGSAIFDGRAAPVNLAAMLTKLGAAPPFSTQSVPATRPGGTP
ncbi:MAG TPA: ribulose-phosphate 3-epimerase [Streptosporangiaceae bacterium]